MTRLPPVETCVSCGRRVDKGNALCPRCLGKKKLAADLARPFPTLPMTRVEKVQAEEAVKADSSVLVRVCPHGFPIWNDCVTCTDAADWDDGGEA